MNENIHCHSVMSVFDGAGSAKAMVKRAKEMGAEFFALTDHGVMTGIFEAWDACEKEGIRFIPGVEAYVESDSKRPYHFILLSKDMEGYRGVSKACSYAEMNRDSEDRPVLKKADMEALFGEGSKYHGHVIATTACIQGEVGQILLTDRSICAQMDKIRGKVEELPNPKDPKIQELQKSYAVLEDDVTNMSDLIKGLKALARKPFKKRFNLTKRKMLAQGIADADAELSFKKSVLPEGYKADPEDIKLFEDMKKAAEAPKLAEEMEESLKKKKAELKKAKEGYDRISAQLAKRAQLIEEAKALKENLKGAGAMAADAKKALMYYANVFGKEDFFAEVQNHGMEEEKIAYSGIAQLAKEEGIRIVASNDVHMIDKKDTHKRELIRAKRFNKYVEASEADKELYMKTDDELKEWLVKILPEDVAEEAIKNIAVIGSMCNVERKKEGYYPVYKLPEGVSADDELERICRANIQNLYPDMKGWTEEHEKRLVHELDVIKRMGFSDYHLIEQDIVEFGKLLGCVPTEKLSEAPLEKEELREWCQKNDYTVGMGVGIGRGSAAGSIVCYLLGITGLDPLKYNLIFERFLNIERVSMPDIDTDFEPEVRKTLVKYVQHKYGEEYVCGIATQGTQQAKASIRNCARYLGDKEYGDGQHYAALADMIAKTIPSKPGVCLEDCWEPLFEKFGSNAAAMQIIDDAKLVEGSFTQYGIHPAGVIISDKDPIIEHMPLMWDENAGMMKTQCDMIQAEKLGLLKMDFLVLKTLTIISKVLQNLKKKGIVIDAYRLPFDASVISNVYAQGNTTAVFQFESSGMRQMLRRFNPDCFEDLVLMNAAYRPGPMEYIPQIIEAKMTGKIEYSIPELEPILGTTYGCIIYQEQVMEIFQKLAGYSLGQADMVRRAMSKKHLDELLLEKEAFLHGDAARNIDGCEKRGIDLAAADDLFERMTAFASYAFNKSHAAVYSYVSYITAYLKEKYPAEYLAEAMTAAKLEKLPSLISEAKRYGVKVLLPSINESEADFSVTSSNEIRFGLGQVKGVKSAAISIVAERKNGRFCSVRSFFERTKTQIGVANALIKAGAFDAFSQSRKALLDTAEEIKNAAADVVAAKELLMKAQEEGKDTSKGEMALERAEEKAASIIIPISMPDDVEIMLKDEHEVLGTFVSAHPMDAFEKGHTDISDAEPTFGRNTTKLVGVISDLRIVQRKKDGKPMAFFVLEDTTGMIETCVYTETYGKYGHMLAEGEVIEISGNINVEYDGYEETEDSEKNEKLQLVAQEIGKAKKKRGTVVVTIPSIDKWKEVNELLKKAYCDDGDNLVVYDQELAEFRQFRTRRYVNAEVFKIGVNATKK